MKKLLIVFIFSAMFLLGCKPKEDPISPSPKPEAPVTAIASVKEITDLAEQSTCSKVNWAQRGVAPLAYMKGMVLVFARSVCNPSKEVSNESLGPSSRDALAHYGLTGSNLNTYAFLIGLGMRESSGKYCTGRDATASNTSAISAESGMFQTSYDSSVASSELPELLKGYGRKCFRETFEVGVSCPASDWKYWGTGIGLEFQKKVKECPAFAAEYAAITLRTLRGHYGPINRKEVQFKQECVSLLKSVQDMVKANPEICSQL